MDDCIFCKIVKGDIPSEKIYENDLILAFLDISPINFGHTLVIPKNHYVNIYETPENVLSEMIKVVKRIAVVLKNTLGSDGLNIGMNNDVAAGQVVMHAHIHVIPRVMNDGFNLWQSKKTYNGEEAKDIAIKISEGL